MLLNGRKQSMLTIGKLAALAQTTPDALRFYEREGYRLYDAEAARRIRFIKQAQHCGFTLAEIHALLDLRATDAACCGDMRKRAIEKKLQLESRIKALKAMSDALGRLIADCNQERYPLDACPILAALESAELTASNGAR